MKVAIPTNDGKNVSSHFGQAKGFLFVEIEGDNIKREEYIPNTFTGHAQHISNENKSSEHSHRHTHSIDVHERVVNKFSGISAVISGGMGYGIKSRLESAGIKTIFTSEKDIRKVLSLFIQGTLQNEENLTCNHRH